MTLVFKVRGGGGGGGEGGNLKAFLESQHMGSYWAPKIFTCKCNNKGHRSENL